jgi:radical SAM superfamily enzyme YgiQ (UPF0313 family)
MAIPKSKRSGGPKTAEGKLAVANNALKTGSYSLKTILPGESEEDLKQLQDQFIKDFLPKNVAESMIVHELSNLTWKLLRLTKLEDAHFLRAINQPISELDLRREGLMLSSLSINLVQDLSPYTFDWLVFKGKRVYLRKRSSRHNYGTGLMSSYLYFK